MVTNRRKMIKMMALSGLGISGLQVTKGFPPVAFTADLSGDNFDSPVIDGLSIIGAYGSAVMGLKGNRLPSYSFRNSQWTDLESWRKAAVKRLKERMAIPLVGGMPVVTVHQTYTYDGLTVEELSWQLPYGAPTRAILLKPATATEPLPAILAFHDHGGNKYFGTRKITKTADSQHPLMAEHQRQYYDGFAWANEIAKRGYVVLVADAFTFASRRVLLAEVPADLRNELSDDDPENPAHISAYNSWAAQHEHVMAKSLFSAGTTWPGMFFAEDKIALDILCARKDVDPARIGCGGLSGGGIRTVFAGGLDPRIKCAVCVGFMTTWDDFVLNKSFTHTWMTYVPLVPNELDFPEILGLRAPLPALVLNNNEDELFTLSDMKKAEAVLRAVYKKTGKPGHFACSYYPGIHKFDKNMQAEAFAWFDKWLKK